MSIRQAVGAAAVLFAVTIAVTVGAAAVAQFLTTHLHGVLVWGPL